MPNEPDVQMNLSWQGDKVTASIVIDKTVKLNIDISPISQLDEAAGKYLDIVNKILKSFTKQG
jgi:hypothetical protein